MTSKTTAQKRVYVGSDGRIHQFGAFPTRYTQEVLKDRVQAFAEIALPVASAEIALVQSVKETVKWGVINEEQARHYCKQMGLPTPMFAADYLALAALAEAAKK